MSIMKTLFFLVTMLISFVSIGTAQEEQGFFCVKNDRPNLIYVSIISATGSEGNTNVTLDPQNSYQFSSVTSDDTFCISDEIINTSDQCPDSHGWLRIGDSLNNINDCPWMMCQL